MPEVLLISGLEEREFSFTAQLLPLDRGILETIYFRAARRRPAPKICWPSTRSATPASRSSGSTTPGHVPDLRAVARTNFCDIGVTLDAAHAAARWWSAPSITW